MVEPTKLFILGAGFSKPAGLPLADELWRNILKSSLDEKVGNQQICADLDRYIGFRQDVFGEDLSYWDVELERFLGFLDIEHALDLRGPDTWSEEGNESQLYIKILIGKILSECMPGKDDISKFYYDFAKKLKSGDVVITFNYDTLLERILYAIGKPYRLFPERFSEVGIVGHTVDQTDYGEIIILKMHGSIDWFNKKSYLKRRNVIRQFGDPSYVPNDVIFGKEQKFYPFPIVDGPRPEDDQLSNIYLIENFEDFYKYYCTILNPPNLINPSNEKLVYSLEMSDLWSGQNFSGSYDGSLYVVGYSFPEHDDYAKQLLYRIIKNYQNINKDFYDIFSSHKKQAIFIDYKETLNDIRDYKNRYRFVNWSNAQLFSEGFCEASVNLISC